MFAFISNYLTYFSELINAYPALWASVQLAATGIALTACRSGAAVVYDALKESLVLTVNVPQSDSSFEWVQFWLAQQTPIQALKQTGSPTLEGLTTSDKPMTETSFLANFTEILWPRGKVPPRKLEASTGSKRSKRWWESSWKTERNRMSTEESSDPKVAKVSFLPATDSEQTVKFKGRYLTFSTYIERQTGERLRYTIITGFLVTRALVVDLIQTAKSEFDAHHTDTIGIYSIPSKPGRGPDAEEWQGLTRKQGRPWESVIIPGQTKEALLADAREFLYGPEFYRKRGLPHRRGYLLYGTPGTGKSSIVSALAAQLKADIYTLNLAHMGLDDAMLQNLLIAVPPRSILLIEDMYVLPLPCVPRRVHPIISTDTDVPRLYSSLRM